MPALQVRDFPEDLYEKLKEVAQQEHRSIAQQTIVAVKSYVEVGNWGISQREQERLDTLARRKALFDRIDALPPFEVPDDFPTPQEIIREMRDGR